MPEVENLLSVSGVAKSFGPVKALVSVDLEVAPGEIHALLGANGLEEHAGQDPQRRPPARHRDDRAGGPSPWRCRPPSPHARRDSLRSSRTLHWFPDLSIVDNLRLTGTDPDAVREWLRSFDMRGPGPVRAGWGPWHCRPPHARPGPRALPRADCSSSWTRSLPPSPATWPSRCSSSCAVGRRWGAPCCSISHRLTEVEAERDRATVLRDGRAVDTDETSEGGEARIVAAMLGERAARVELPALRPADLRPRRATAPGRRAPRPPDAGCTTGLCGPGSPVRSSASSRWRRRARRSSSRSSPATSGPARSHRRWTAPP